MDKLFCILVTGLASLIVPMVYTQQIALRHNGTTYNDIAYIKEDSVFYIECKTQVLENLALTIRLPAIPTCAQCYPNGFKFVHNDCKDFVQFQCLTNGTFRGELTVNVPPLGRYYCTYINAENDTYLLETIEPCNVTINGSAYAEVGEKSTFTCSTSIAAPRPTFEWFMTDVDGTDKEIDGDKKESDDEDRHYNTIQFVVSSRTESMDIWCVAKQTAFDVDITSEKLKVDILVRTTPPEWESESTTVTDNNQYTTDSDITFQGLRTGEVIGIVLGSVFGAAILLTIITFCCCPETLASCGLLSCCVKSATLKNTAETIPIE